MNAYTCDPHVYTLDVSLLGAVFFGCVLFTSAAEEQPFFLAIHSLLPDGCGTIRTIDDHVG